MGKEKDDKKWSEMTEEEQNAMSDADALDAYYGEIAENGK